MVAQDVHETKFLLPSYTALMPMMMTWESLGGGRGDSLLGAAADDGLDGLLGEEDAHGLADVVGAEGAPTGLIGIAVVNGVVLVLLGHAVFGGRPGIDGAELDVIVLHHNTGDKTADARSAHPT